MFTSLVFGYCERISVRSKIVILHPSPSRLIQKCFRNQTFLKEKRGLLRSFSVLIKTKIPRKIVILHRFALVILKFFDSRNFVKHRRVCLRSFSTLRQNEPRRKIVIHQSYSKTFREPEI